MPPLINHGNTEAFIRPVAVAVPNWRQIWFQIQKLMSTGFDLKTAQAQWVLGLIPSDELPSIAMHALSASIESKYLVKLAILARDEMRDSSNLFERSLSELGYKSMEKIDALKHYAALVSTLILASEVTPLEGARRIGLARSNAKIDGFHDLDGFIYAVSEMVDRPKDKKCLKRG